MMYIDGYLFICYVFSNLLCFSPPNLHFIVHLCTDNMAPHSLAF